LLKVGRWIFYVGLKTGLKTQRPLNFQPGENNFDDTFSIPERDLIMVRRGDLNAGYPCLCERRPGPLQSPVRPTRCLAYCERYPTAGLNDCCGYRQKAPSVRKHPDASSLQPELRRLYRVWVAIVELYGGNKKSARIFLNGPQQTS
jgi:hypothetical protein